MSIEEIKNRAIRLKSSRDYLMTRKSNLASEISHLESNEELLALSSELIKKMIDSEVVQGVKSIESLISEGLQEVFGSDLRLPNISEN